MVSIKEKNMNQDGEKNESKLSIKPRVKYQGRNMETKSFSDGGTRMTKQRAMNDFTEDKT